MVAENGAVHLNGAAGALGGIASTNRLVRADLQLIDRMVTLGLTATEKYPAILALCEDIRIHGKTERDRVRAAELETKLLALSLNAAQHSDKNNRIDSGKATDRTEHEHRVVAIVPDRKG